MQRIHLNRDIQPLSEFRANAANFLDQVKKTGRLIVITQRGKSSAVLMDVNEYERLLERIETLNDIHEAEKQIKNNELTSHKSAKSRILKNL